MSTTSIPSSDFIDFVANQLDIIRIGLLAEANEIGVTVSALRGGVISIEAAILHLNEYDPPMAARPSSSAA